MPWHYNFLKKEKKNSPSFFFSPKILFSGQRSLSSELFVLWNCLLHSEPSVSISLFALFCCYSNRLASFPIYYVITILVENEQAQRKGRFLEMIKNDWSKYQSRLLQHRHGWKLKKVLKRMFWLFTDWAD